MLGMSGTDRAERVVTVVADTLRRVLGGDREPGQRHHLDADVFVRVVPTDSHDMVVVSIPRSATRQVSLLAPSSDHGGVGGAFRDLDLERPDDHLKNNYPGKLDPNQVGATAPNRAKTGGRKRKTPQELLDRIPARAWAAADYIRDQILAQDPKNIVVSQPWGPTVTTGWRFKWANEIRLMVTNDKRGFTVDDYYTEVAKSLAWVFKGQTNDERYRIVVESASALRQKWDQIQRLRRRDTAPIVRPARPSSVTPVNRKLV